MALGLAATVQLRGSDVPLMYEFTKGLTTGPPITILWDNGLGAHYDFSTGYTFTARIVDASTPGVLLGTKSSGFVGSAYSQAAPYNLTISMAAGDFTALPGDRTYRFYPLIATPSAGLPFEFHEVRFILHTAAA